MSNDDSTHTRPSSTDIASRARPSKRKKALSHSTMIVTSRGPMRTSEPNKTFQRLEPIAILVGSTLPVLPFEDGEDCLGLPRPIIVRRSSSVVCQIVNFKALAADELQHLFSARCAWSQGLFWPEIYDA